MLRRRSTARRGIYLLPTLFTLGNLFCGYSSMVQASVGQLELAAMLIVVAAILDALDGRIARLTGTTSDFGLEFDSLADLVSFGLAPAMLVWHWALRPSDRIGWLLAFLYVVCAAMRLARFNTQASAASDRRWFVGLPSPMAGGMIAAIVLVLPAPRPGGVAAALLAGAVFAVAVLMISRLRYRSLRAIDLRNRRPHFLVLPIAAVLVAVALQPKGVLFVTCTAYLLSAPTLYLASLLVRHRRPDARAGASAEVSDGPVFR